MSSVELMKTDGIPLFMKVAKKISRLLGPFFLPSALFPGCNTLSDSHTLIEICGSSLQPKSQGVGPVNKVERKYLLSPRVSRAMRQTLTSAPIVPVIVPVVV